MAARYITFGSVPQLVNLLQPVNMIGSTPCRSGNVHHEDGTGVFILGSRTCGQFYATYKVSYSGNIAVPEGGTAGPIALAISINGQERAGTRAIATPAAALDYWNVSGGDIIRVPRGCCFDLAIVPVNGNVNDPTAVPAPAINVVDLNVTIDRIA
jgi:hypothetical protein